jgi:hypothetical protein
MKSPVIAAFFLALILLHSLHASAAPRQHLEAAQAGSVEDMYALGQLYEFGLGVKQDRGQAIEWYLAAAQKGHPEASYQVGYAYYRGRGLPKNQTEAHRWFLLAAENGCRKAMPYLSKMYALGQGVPRDKLASQRWSDTLLRLKQQDHLQKRLQPADGAKRSAQEQDKPKPSASADSQSPSATSKAGQATPVNEALVQRLLQTHWLENGGPASHLPSRSTGCTAGERSISCLSQRLRGNFDEIPYFFAISSSIEDLTQANRFTLRYQTHFIAPEQALDEEARTALEDQVNGKSNQMACELAGEAITCQDNKGNNYLFTVSSDTLL